GAASAVVSAASSIIPVKGRTDLGFRWTVIRLFTNPVFILVGSLYGLYGVVIAHSISSIIYLFIYHPLLIDKIIQGFNFQKYLKSFADFILFTGLSYGVLYYCKILFFYNFSLSVMVPLFSIVFDLVYLALNKKQLYFLKSFVTDKGF